jgi:DNA-binding transcriptional regulator YiaG
MNKKPNYYAIIPAKVRYDNTLRPNAKLLYAEITALCNMNGKCMASTQYFAKLYNVSRVAVQNWLKQLEENKHIIRTVIYKEGSKQILHRYITLIDKGNQYKLIDNNNINIKNNNITYSNKRFKKPTIDEIVLYCVERNSNIQAVEFYDFYESKGWKVGKNKMKDWKAAVRNWERRDKKKPNMSKLDAQINAWSEAKKLL